MNAYPIKPNATIPGMPGWGNSSLFDVDAKADDQTAAAAKTPPREAESRTQLMLQALLADRFKLRVHHEIRQGSVYQLVVAKGGVKLKNAPDSENGGGYSWGNGKIQVHKGPVASLVFCLSDGIAGRTVIDKTGLTGNYNIDLNWTPDDKQSADDAGPSLFTALEEQLGLKLEPGKGPVDVFVIDHVEKPSEN